MKIEICIIIFLVCIASHHTTAESGYGSDDYEISYEFEDKASCITFSTDVCKILKEKIYYRKNCTECNCMEENRMTCCSLLKKPVDWPAHCYVKLNRRKCVYELRQLTKPHLKCNKVKHVQKILDTETILQPDE